MNYKKIRMEYRYKKDRLNRTILVREDINLIELGCAMCTAVRAEFEHCFLFLKGRTHYSPDVFIEEGWDDVNEVPMKEYSLSDLGDKFSFWYDTGDDWLFDCKVYKREVKLDNTELAFLVDGTGQGIWEDNAWTLGRYLDGELDPDCAEENEEEGIYFPWNFKIEKLSDFDTKFNIAEEKELFDESLDSNIEMYLDDMHEGGFELEVKPRTAEELDDVAADDSDPTVNMHLNTVIMKVIDEQIKTVDYVNAKYRELAKKYGDLTARNKIGVVLATEMFEAVVNGKKSSNSEYKKKIEKIR